MKKIASLPVRTASVFKKCNALLRFVSTVGLIIATKLLLSVCEFAFSLVRTIPVFNKFFAKLRFLLISSREVLDEYFLRTLA